MYMHTYTYIYIYTYIHSMVWYSIVLYSIVGAGDWGWRKTEIAGGSGRKSRVADLQLRSCTARQQAGRLFRRWGTERRSKGEEARGWGRRTRKSGRGERESRGDVAFQAARPDAFPWENGWMRISESLAPFLLTGSQLAIFGSVQLVRSMQSGALPNAMTSLTKGAKKAVSRDGSRISVRRVRQTRSRRVPSSFLLSTLTFLIALAGS